ncbi:LysR family transcriptional regulator [Chelatococcus sp. SYSU_G07232]|uniref:LysR family transcriptional regulator n=1 Tax=Chelatococcus albus TaxID=3047466 RepID=A0ABT7AEJ4_9HYPH|nr:LysR family transcriptional regulator [Chelatococcus sp. SYSU_G07232]MDJ1157799.1 LysR family transcriptional regulator [Chelatococcus sp. SYSU_G07232]
MNLDDLRALVAVAEAGSLARAATRLNLTQPAVTRRIQRLEADLGVLLLDRDQKPARLTRDGELAYRQGLKLLNAANSFAAEMAGEREAPPLRIGISNGIADTVLGLALDAVRHAAPHLRLVLAVDHTKDLVKRLVAHELDAVLGVRALGLPFEGPFNARQIARERVIVVAPAEHPIDARTTLAELAHEPWVINPDGCGFRTQLDRALARVGASVDVAVELWGTEMQLALVARGAGLCLVPARMLMASPWRSRLKPLDVSDFQAELAVWLITSPDLGARAPAVEALAQAVEHEMLPARPAAE